jgi:hypothetical protein
MPSLPFSRSKPDPRVRAARWLAPFVGFAVLGAAIKLRAGRKAATPEPFVPPVGRDGEPTGGAHISPRGEEAIAATPPIETPGPSVPAPATAPESDVERAERADALTSLPDPADPDAVPAPIEEVIAEQEAAAAAEAAAIGGPPMHDADDPAMDPVYQAGGGEQEGFELAERDLIENATHGDGHGDPVRDALRPELESDRSGAVYGEADEERPSEEPPGDRQDV